MPRLPLCVTAYSIVCAAGFGRAQLLEALRQRRGGLRANDFTATPLQTWIGRVPGLELPAQALPPQFAAWDCRNNRLAWAGLLADDFLDRVRVARERYGPARVALILGTSTSSIGASEEAYRRIQPDGRYPPDLRNPVLHMPHSLGNFVQEVLGLRGPCATVATACSSSAKVFAQAERLIRLGVCDAAVVGGVDSLCNSVLFGFNSLELLSAQPCRPFAADRNGISLGEAAGFALLQRAGEGPWLLGSGESSDAHHMSAPHPEGLGARHAVRQALASAGIEPEQIDYINLHGTASRKNDEVEAKLVAEMFPQRVYASSTKGWTGHTLGAAGIVEAAITFLALESGLIPGTLNSTTLDPACGPQLRLQNRERRSRFALSHSFGFGGSNCALLFGSAQISS